VTTSDRGQTWTNAALLGVVNAARPIWRDRLIAVVEPRACPGAAPCSEVRDLAAGAISRLPYTATASASPWAPWSLVAPAASWGAAVACAKDGQSLAPVAAADGIGPLVHVVATFRGFLGTDALDRDLVEIRGGRARRLLGTAGFPAADLDAQGDLYGLRGAD